MRLVNRFRQLLQRTPTSYAFIAIWGIALWLFLLLFWRNGWKIGVHDDSDSYILAADVIMGGSLDYLRTPIYPLFCRFFIYFFDTFGLWLIVAVQFVVMQIAALCMYKTAFLITKQRNISLFAMAAFAWFPPCLLDCTGIITESLSFSGTVFLLWLIACMLFKPNSKAHIYAPFALVLLIMLRPFFVCYTLALIVAEIFCAWQKRSITAQATLASASATIIILAYCFGIYKTYGEFTLSSVSKLNRDVCMHHAGVLDFYDVGTHIGPQLSKPTLHSDGFIMKDPWIWRPTLEHLHYTDSVYAQSTLKMMRYRAINVIATYTHSNMHPAFQLVHFPLSGHFRMGVIPVFALFYFFLELAIWLKKRRMVRLVLATALTGIVTGAYFTTYWASYEHFFRITSPSLPALFIMAALLIHYATSKPAEDTTLAQSPRL